MAHTAGQTGWLAWTDGVDASVAANVTAIAGRTTPADVDTKIATQHTADGSTYAPVAEPIGAAAQTTANAAIPATQKGAALGVATLDSGGIVPAAQLPAASGGAWTAYTPVLTASTTNPTMGTAPIAVGKYTQNGKTVTYQWFIQFGTGSPTAGSGNYSISLPVTGVMPAQLTTQGQARIYHAGNALFIPSRMATTTTAALQYTATFLGALSPVSNAAPWTWAAGDIIDGTITYEAV